MLQRINGSENPGLSLPKCNSVHALQVPSRQSRNRKLRSISGAQDGFGIVVLSKA